MNPKDDLPQGKENLFSGPLLPVLFLRLVEALSFEHQGHPAAIEQALHDLGKTMTTPLLVELVRRYAKPHEAFIPSKPELFLNRVDEYLTKNWELATGSPPQDLEFTDDHTLILRTSSCPICSYDVFDAHLNLRYCELVSGMLEGLLQTWIDNLQLPYTARVTQTAGRLQGDPSCEFKLHFSDANP
ncbi:MAG: hypothetical protein ACFE89_02480 [Candidatus Hodarchaeota archaeon]